MNAGSLHCPNCGAAVSSDSPKCAFCKSHLQTVACPRCMGMMFEGTQFCPQCGAATESVTIGLRTTHACPRCEKSLLTVEVGRFVVEQCETCGGFWMPLPVFDQICAEAEDRSAAAAIALPPAVLDEHPKLYLLCPVCREHMSRMNYAKRSGVITDICRPHGIWIDRDELGRIVAFIDAGGLQRARELEKMRLDAARRALDFEKRSESNPLTGRREYKGDDDGTGFF